MQHPFDNPEIAAASQLRGRVGQAEKPPVLAAPHHRIPLHAPSRAAPGRFRMSSARSQRAKWQQVATGASPAAHVPATTGCHPHVPGPRPGAIR